jgi:predicted small metal-binding protein
MNPSEHQTGNRQTGTHDKLNFRCSDVGPKNCDWQVSGNSEEEIMPKIEQHGREKHHMTIDENTKQKVRGAIHRKAA